VLFTDWLLWIALACAIGIWLFEWSLHLVVIWMARTSAPLLPDSELSVPVVVPVHAIAVVFLAFFYGWYRAGYFSPISHKSYGIWLAQTPWHVAVPAPLGPIQIVWQDLFALAMLAVVVMLPPRDRLSPLHIAPAFASAYCATYMYALVRLKSYQS